MTLQQTEPATAVSMAKPIQLLEGLYTLFEKVPGSAVSLLARVGIAGIFWRSGQTKVNGWEIRDTTFDLFRDEYALPLIPYEFATYMATIAEHLFPVLLFVGLASRLSAAALLGMTAVIQIFVYPTSWPDHALWAAALLFIVSRGPGMLSLDHLVARFLTKTRA